MDFTSSESYNYTVIYLASSVLAILFPGFITLHRISGRNRCCANIRNRRVRPTNKPPSADMDAEISESSTLARKIQRAMIPRSLPSLEGIELNALFLSSGKCGGDLFDVIKLDDELIAFVMVDVACDGIEPILITAMAKICFVNHITQRVLPYAVIERVNSELFHHIGANLHLTAFVGYLDLHDLKLTYCNTMTSAPILYRRIEGNVELLSGHHVSIGSSAEILFEEQYVHLRLGDELVLFTDGLDTLFSNAAENRMEITEYIRTQLCNAPVTSLFDQIELHFNEAGLQNGVTDDISVVSVEVLTQSKKNLIKDKLGFRGEDKVYLQFLSYLEEMDRTTATILTALDIAGFKDEDIRKMKIILTELLVNAIIHGNHKDHSKRVTVGHLIDPQQAVVSIMDEGEGFDPAVIPDPTLPENLEKPCGRGLFIVRHYVESISFNETGNRVTITKKNLLE